MPWARVASALAVAVSISACAEAVPLHVAWPDANYAAAFLIESNELGVQNVRGPFGLERGQITFGNDAYFAEADLDVHLIGLRPDRLDEIVPLFDADRASEVALSEEAVSCRGGRYERSLDRVLIELTPELAELSSLDREEQQFVTETDLTKLGTKLSVRLPISADRCIENPIESWHAFGEATTLPGIDSPVTFEDVVHLTEDRVIVSSVLGLDVIDRNGRIDLDDPIAHWSTDRIEPPSGRYWTVSRLSAMPLSSDRWRIVGLAHAEALRPEVEEVHAVLELVWTSSAGFSSLRRSALYPPRFRDLHVRADGAIAVVGSAGRVLIGPAADAIEEWRIDSELEELTVIAETGYVDEPFIIGSDQGGFWLGDPHDKRLRADSTAQFLSGPSSIAARAESAGFEVWTPTYSSQMQHRTVDGAWEAFSFYTSPEANVCARQDDECGLPVTINAAEELALSPRGHLLMPSRTCSGFFEIDPARKCAVLVPEEGRALETWGSDRDMRRVSVTQKHLVIVGGPSLILEADLE